MNSQSNILDYLVLSLLIFILFLLWLLEKDVELLGAVSTDRLAFLAAEAKVLVTNGGWFFFNSAGVKKECFKVGTW